MIVIVFPKKGRRTTARTRAASAAVRDRSKPCGFLVEEYVWIGRYVYQGIIVDEWI